MNARRWLVGRLPNCDIVVPVQEVSSEHCELVQSANGFTLVDLGSSNGTFVNGQRLGNTPVVVTPKDRITLGVKTPFPWPAEALTPSRASAERTITIGRLPENDVVLNYPQVSGRHARIVVHDGHAEIEDLGSSNGTAIGTPDNRVQRSGITPKDVVYFGSYRVPAERLFGAKNVGASQGTTRVAFEGRAMLFGRREDCDQVLNYPMISGHHARLTRTNDGLVLEDLHSANGTFVNGWRIAVPVLVKPGDVIGLGTFTFTLLDAGGSFESNDLRSNVTLEARDVRFRAGRRTLIDGISLTVYGGEFVGLMGPSGAGKTTLMNTLNGYTPPTEGEVLINGHDVYRHYDWFRHCIGYVPQEDVMHRDLTVGQALYYSARLRLPSDFTDADLRDRVTTVLEQLGLAGTEDVLIGSAEKKGISGGQRKRVNLAMELLTDPLILFLDEPTSGLSSEDAVLVMNVLKALAAQGKVIILTIHQPSLEIYQLLDHLTVVAKDANSTEPGRLSYFGPAYPDALQFFNPEGIVGLKPGQEPSPDEVLRGLKSRPAHEWTRQYERSKYQQLYVEDRAGTELHDLPPPDAPVASPMDWFTQWRILTQRSLMRKFADRIGTGILLGQAPAFALLLVLVFGKSLSEEVTYANWLDIATSVGRVVFQLTLAAIWFGCSNSIREVVGEWAVYKRERMVNLKLIPYVASKFTMLGALSVIQCLILLVVVHYGCGLKANLIVTFVLMLLASFVGVALGLLISAASRTNEIAIALLPLVQLVMVVLGGGMQSLHKMPEAIQLVAQTMPSRWAFEGAILMEVKEHPKQPAPPIIPPEGFKAPDMAEGVFPQDKRTSTPTAFMALSMMFVLFSGSVLVILRLRDVH